MNTMIMTAAALVLSATLMLSPALAAGPKASGGGFAQSVPEAAAPNTAPHYEWQYGYVGHHPRVCRPLGAGPLARNAIAPLRSRTYRPPGAVHRAGAHQERGKRTPGPPSRCSP